MNDVHVSPYSVEELRSLLDNSPDVFVRWDRNLRRLFVNRTFLTAIGVSSYSEALGQRFGDGIAAPGGNLYAPIEVALRRVFTSGQAEASEYVVEPPDGTTRIVEMRLVPERDESGEVVSVLGISRDLTAQRLAEEARSVSDKRLRQVTEAIDEVFWLTSPDKSEFTYVSAAYERVFGRTVASLLAAPCSWLEAVHPDDRQRVQEAIPTQRLGTYDIEYRIERTDGIRWVRDRASPVRGDDGSVTYIAGVAEDVTARKELEAQLIRAQKLEAVGQLAGGIAHDFNNMLAVIRMQTALLVEQFGAVPELADGLGEILGAAERASGLTRQLLTLGQRPLVSAERVDLKDLLSRTLNLIGGVLGSQVRVVADFPAELPPVIADPGLIEQVFVNLVINARDAMAAWGTIRVGLAPLASPPAEAPDATRSWVSLTVQDTGHGIAPADRARIFEPFFTTKPPGRGTGLGLATVAAVVAQHGGFIRVTSELGAGTTFEVLLPTASAET